MNYSKLRYTSTRSYVRSIIHHRVDFEKKNSSPLIKLADKSKLNDIEYLENCWRRTGPIENNGRKIEEGFLHGKIIVAWIARYLPFARSLFRSVRKCVRVIGTMSLALVNGMEIRSSRGPFSPGFSQLVKV